MDKQEQRSRLETGSDSFPSDVVITVTGRALEDLAALRELTRGASDYEIVQEALAAYRAELSFQEVEV